MAGIEYTCAQCGEGEPHGHGENEWPALGFARPDAYVSLSEAEKESIAEASNDLCVIAYADQIDRFVRGTMSIPIIGEDRTLEYGPWTSVSEQSFEDYVDHYEDPDHHEHYFGWLATEIPGYEFPEPLALQVITRGLERPHLMPDPESDHPLARDVHHGITREEAELRIRSLLLDDSIL